MATAEARKNEVSATGRKNKDSGATYVLSRYTRLEALFEMIELGGIPLYGTERWDDECDKAFVERGCREYGIDEERCGVICFSRSQDRAAEKEKDDSNGETEKLIWPKETSAHWLLNDKPSIMDDPTSCLQARIRIEFKEKEILASLFRFTTAELQDTPMWLFKGVDYKGFPKFLKKAKTSKETVGWFFHKRDAYYWEGEWRLVALNQDVPPKAKVVGAKGFIPIGQDEDRWKQVIKRVVFSPYSSARGFPTKLDMERIRFYANRALEFYCIGRSEWSQNKKELVKELWAKGRGYRSGVLDNKKVLAAAQAELPTKSKEGKLRSPKTKPAKNASAKKRAATTKGGRK